MVKRLIIIPFLSGLLFINNLHAQNFEYGIETGIIFAKSYLANADNLELFGADTFDPISTLNLNGYLGYKGIGKFGLSIEPGYIQKGMKNQESSFKFNYFQVPLMVNFYLSERFYFSAGPELSFLMNSIKKTGKIKTDFSDDIDHAFEVAALAGFNYKITRNIDIGIRFSQGLNSFDEESWLDSSFENDKIPGYYHRYFQLLLRYKLFQNE
jgi:hypothetical protein